MMSSQKTDLPDVIEVVDFILLQYTPPHFYHPLHYKQTNHINMVMCGFQLGFTVKYCYKLKYCIQNLTLVKVYLELLA